MALRMLKKPPKYARIEQAIVEDILRGVYVPGGRIPSETNLGLKVGAARMTVRRAIEELVSQGVLERHHCLGTFVCRQVRRTVNVALLAFHASSSPRATLRWNLVEALRRAAEQRGHELRVMVLVDRKPWPTQVAAELRALGVRAVGLAGFLDTDREYVRALAEQLPCVLFNKCLLGLALPCAQPDCAEAARLIVGYLAERGRRRVSLVSSSLKHSLHQELAMTVAAELCRRGLPVDKSLWFNGPQDERADYASNDEMARWLRQMAGRDPHPDAFIVPGMDLPRAVQQTLEARGERLGREADVVALSNAFEEDTVKDPWTTLLLNLADATRAASQMLLDIVEGKQDLGAAPVYMAKPKLIPPAAEAPSPQPTRPRG